MDPLRTTLDRWNSETNQATSELKRRGAAVTSSALDKGMKFKVEDRVIDLATGQRGVVRVAEARAGTKQGLYAVLLDDSRTILRGEDELVGTLPAAVL